ncbi:MG284/MPN403 family protein [Mesomycoplasma molare]|uniref:Uncharacterized protein n=1 Tax=Mesomycoplasma molare TaxID=171288 RepID=A0ABY5TVU7_9BACT|nr:hypothetical protein [Mesomycoplasma molare]UWD34126.1 hypothetical protein NX772_03495 [Mesomycoplasma molare]
MKKITYIEKKKFMEILVLMHNKFQIENTLELKNKNNTKLELFNMKTKSTFSKIMELLEPEYAYIIKKEFIENEKEWFKEHWSKTTYYKNINKAIDRFLFYLYG